MPPVNSNFSIAEERITACITGAQYNSQQQREQRDYHSISKRATRLFKFVILPLLTLLIAFQFRHVLILLVIAVIAGLINYAIHASGIHLHLGHVTFLNVLFSYQLGWEYGLAMIVIGHILPEVFSGHIDSEMIISALIYALIAFLASTFSFLPFIQLGIALIVLQTTLSVVIGFIFGTPFTELLTEHGVEHILVMIWYLQFSHIILALLV